nr:SAHS [Acutuncus antarcticus]WPK49628.1 SAHS [Acutuncus antarcticus]
MADLTYLLHSLAENVLYEGLHGGEFGGNPKSFVKIWKEGEHYRLEFTVPSHNYKRSYSFKMGQEGSHIEPKFNNNRVTYTFTEDGDKLFAEVKVPAMNLIFKDSYQVTGDELVRVSFTTGC